MKKYLASAILAIGAASAPQALATQPAGVQIENGVRWDFTPGNFATQWSWDMSRPFVGNPQAGCAVYGPYASIDAAGDSGFQLYFNKFKTGSRNFHSETCVKRNVFRQCTDKRVDNRSRPGSVVFDMLYLEGGVAQRSAPQTVGGENFRDLPLTIRPTDGVGKFTYGFPVLRHRAPLANVEMRICNWSGVDRGDAQLDFAGGVMWVTY